MSEPQRSAGTLQAHDRVEMIDRLTGSRVHALVESTSAEDCVLLHDRALPVPEAAHLRWFDGAQAWQATARLEQIDATRVRCRLIPPDAWQPASGRRSPRVRIGDSQLLVRIVSSSTIPSGRRVHAECLEASATGCRARWPGQTPRTGDTVDLTWDIAGQARGACELGWIAARVARVIPRSTGRHEVGFSFETTKSTQIARIRSWHQAWLQLDAQRVTGGA